MSKSYRKSGRHDMCNSRRGSIRAARAAWNRAQRHADRARLNWSGVDFDRDDLPPPRPVDPWSLPSDGKTWDDDIRA